MFHIKIRTNYNTATKIFFAAYIKLCYDLCDSFLESRYNNRVIVIIELLFNKYSRYSENHMSTDAVDV